MSRRSGLPCNISAPLHPLGTSPWLCEQQQGSSGSSSYGQRGQSLTPGSSDYCLRSKEADPAFPSLELHLPVTGQPGLDGLRDQQPSLGCSDRQSAAAGGQTHKLLSSNQPLQKQTGLRVCCQCWSPTAKLQLNLEVKSIPRPALQVCNSSFSAGLTVITF